MDFEVQTITYKKVVKWYGQVQTVFKTVDVTMNTVINKHEVGRRVVVGLPLIKSKFLEENHRRKSLV